MPINICLIAISRLLVEKPVAILSSLLFRSPILSSSSLNASLRSAPNHIHALHLEVLACKSHFESVPKSVIDRRYRLALPETAWVCRANFCSNSTWAEKKQLKQQTTPNEESAQKLAFAWQSTFSCNSRLNLVFLRRCSAAERIEVLTVTFKQARVWFLDFRTFLSDRVSTKLIN